MAYINIPYVRENDRINKDLVRKEIQLLEISDEAKSEAYAAVYNIRPRGVSFGDNLQGASALEHALIKLEIPCRQSEESPY
jgi:hypothetical protein